MHTIEIEPDNNDKIRRSDLIRGYKLHYVIMCIENKENPNPKLSESSSSTDSRAVATNYFVTDTATFV